MKIRISYVLPCFNVEKYISDCLDSLCNQDISLDEFEIICVNDCSDDDTRDIILEYKAKYENIILIDHFKNQKQGAARNTGLDFAQGEYIWFIDPDDYIKSKIVNKLLHQCEINNLDLLIFNFDKVSNAGDFIFKSNFVSNSKPLNGYEFVDTMWGNSFLDNYDGSIWNRLHRRIFLLENNIRFPSDMFWEDVEHSLRTILFSNRMMSISDSIYCYRSNPNSVIQLGLVSIKINVVLQQTILLGNLLSKLANDIYHTNPIISNKIKEGSIWRINNFTKSLIKSSFKQKMLFYIFLKKNDKAIQIGLPHFNLLNRLIIFNPMISKFLFCLAQPFIYTLVFLKNKKG